jgi:hypothetical protein
VTTKRKRRLALVVLLLLTIGSAAYAFTAANTVPNTQAGIGSGTISGYTVTNVEYNLEAANPANIDSVEFDLNGAAGTVKAKVVSSSTTYTDCTAAGTHYTCDFAANPTVLSADQLTVISVQ